MQWYLHIPPLVWTGWSFSAALFCGLATALLWFGLVRSPRGWQFPWFFFIMDFVGEFIKVQQFWFSRSSRRNRIRGRRTLPDLVFVLMLSMIVSGHASEDEQTRLWMRQRSMAQAMQNPTPPALAYRWQVFERTYQLVRPIPGGHYDASIARPSDDLLHDARSMGIRVQYAAEPSAVGRAIEVFWWDIRIEMFLHTIFGKYIR